MKQAANDATGAGLAGITPRNFKLYGAEFVIPEGQSRADLLNAEGCLIDCAIGVIEPAASYMDAGFAESQMHAANVILQLLSAINGELQRLS